MKISAISPIYFSKSYNPSFSSNSISSAVPLKFDTVSFGAMKKKQFSGIDLLIVNKFKAPIEKFNTNDDLQDWCEEKVDTITQKDYQGRRNETKIQRKAILKEWFDYVKDENDAYTNAISLLIFDSITKNLKENDDTLPPILSKGILAQTIDEIQNQIKQNPKIEVNFLKTYKLNLQKSMLNKENNDAGGNFTGWVKIPSYKNDPDNFESNVQMLKLLSHDNWCTKSFNARPYLEDGDFHVYLENGKPKLGVRFFNNTIAEIQGEKNNSEIPLKYFDIVQEHVKNEKLSIQAEKEIKKCLRKKTDIERIVKEKLPKGIKNSSPEEIFKAFDIDVKKDKDGFLIISHYEQPAGFTFEDAGINENELIKNVKKIEGNVKFNLSGITNLGSLQEIGGEADFRGLQMERLDNLQFIGGDAYFAYSKIKDLGSLKAIKGFVLFSPSNIENLGDLQFIGGFANFSSLKIKDLGNLRIINGDANFSYSQITNLGNLSKIGGNAYFDHSQIKDLGNLRIINGDANFGYLQIESLGELQSIGGTAIFSNSKIKDLGSLKTIGGDAVFIKSHIGDIEKLEKIGHIAYVDTYNEELIEQLKEKGIKVFTE